MTAAPVDAGVGVMQPAVTMWSHRTVTMTLADANRRTGSRRPARGRRHSTGTALSLAVPATGVAVAGVETPVAVRRSQRARRLTLRVDPRVGTAHVVAPLHVPQGEIAQFVARHAGWLRLRLAAVPPSVPFVPGAVVPFLGIDHEVRHDPAASHPVARAGRFLVVGGRLEHLARRLRDFLVAEARRELTVRSHALADTIGRRVAGVGVRDTRSRWGSCSVAGRLSFCWRLILAPEHVLDYVVAHEVAHLVEPNHSPRFWTLVRRLCPTLAVARSWLKANGARLYRYG